MDTCDVAIGCMHAAISCNDNDVCTTDTCAPLTGCAHTHDTHGMMTFEYTGSMQSFAVPMCVTSIHVVAAGAAGGAAPGAARPGGLGATLAGDFVATPGQMLTILVGGAGIDALTSNDQRGGSGGGGTFVTQGATILVVAGGGGGAHGNGSFGSGPGGPGQITTNGQPGGAPDNEPAGTNGTGGTTLNCSGCYQGGTGGGGYLGDGINNSNGNVSSYGTVNTPGRAFMNGGAGGTGGSSGRNGGFGGGGAAGFTGGGGGGYSGGGAGGSPASGTVDHSGGGGGSINTGTMPVNVSGNHVGNGQVTITW